MNKQAGKKSWLVVFLGLVLFISTLWFGYFQHQNQTNYRAVFSFICDKVRERIYLSDPAVKPWHEDCLKQSAKISLDESTVQVKMQINAQLSQLGVSHLLVYSPDQVQRVWNSEFKTTGIIAHYVDGEVVVVKVLANSSAAQSGLKRGDLIKTINGKLAMAEEAAIEPGEYQIVRNSEKLIFKLTATELSVDDQVKLTEMSSQLVYLEVPSFRADFFDSQIWNEKINQLKKYKQIIIDLRGNSGGNFAAGLRFLSPFLCEPTVVGALEKPKLSNQLRVSFPNEMANEQQISFIEKNAYIELKTFPNYQCIKAKILVLAGPQTASTAEIVAQALHEHAQAPIWGSSTAGQCLVGIWYPLDGLGPGYEISIPEAIYSSQSPPPRTEKVIEGSGVAVSKILFERIEDYKSGQDSLLLQAAKYFSN